MFDRDLQRPELGAVVADEAPGPAVDEEPVRAMMLPGTERRLVPASRRRRLTTSTRATAIGGVSRTYDILGNTLTIGSSKTMTWDCLNRMVTYNGGSATTAYTYRADGMRVKKGNPNTPNVYTNYAYDGQMPIEEFNYRAAYNTFTFIKVIRYGLGARGIDRIEREQVSGTKLVGYPMYDAHGNMIATLMEGSGNTCSLNDSRSYDAWGVIRTGNTSGEPHPTHCANLGHLQDDESGFVYMRARYYEPGAGRFVSQDPSKKGANWFEYCANDPVNRVDTSGKDAWDYALFVAGMVFMVVAWFQGEFFLSTAGGVASAAGLVKSIIADLAAAKARAIISEQTARIIELENRIMNSWQVDAADYSLAAPAIRAMSAEAGRDEGVFLAEDLDAWFNEGGGGW